MKKICEKFSKILEKWGKFTLQKIAKVVYYYCRRAKSPDRR